MCPLFLYSLGIRSLYCRESSSHCVPICCSLCIRSLYCRELSPVKPIHPLSVLSRVLPHCAPIDCIASASYLCIVASPSPIFSCSLCIRAQYCRESSPRVSVCCKASASDFCIVASPNLVGVSICCVVYLPASYLCIVASPPSVLCVCLRYPRHRLSVMSQDLSPLCPYLLYSLGTHTLYCRDSPIVFTFLV